MATLIAVLIAGALSAEPAQLVLGKDAGAELTLQAPAGAKVTLSSSVGTVGEAKREGDVFRARFTAPPLKVPSVALVLAQIEQDGARELAWLAIPMSGSDTMEIETRAGASVEAIVAGKVVGPVTADKNGIARLPMVVPPGVDKATLHISDKLGNKSDKPLDLEPPPFSRVRVAPRQSWVSAAVPLEVEIFVVRPDGTPDDAAKVELSTGDGEAEVRRRIGPGVYLGKLIASPRLTGQAHLDVKANGQLAALDVTVDQAKVLIAQPPWRSALATERAWSLAIGLLGGVGSTFDGATEGSVRLETAMRLEILPVELVLDLGASFFNEVTQYGATPTNAQKAKAQSRHGEFGLRFGKQLVTGLDGHLTLLAGLQSQVVGRTLPNGQFIADDAWTPRLALALGANIHFGPGRALLQVMFDSSADGIAGLAGSLSGVQAMAGYLVTVR